MKTSNTTLSAFIIDFNLELPGAGVCFNADIEFVTASIFKKFNCEVHIITMDHTQTSIVYLLHQDLVKDGIPDIFPFDAKNFFYKRMGSLNIIDYDLLRGKFSLSISPIKKRSAILINKENAVQ